MSGTRNSAVTSATGSNDKSECYTNLENSVRRSSREKKKPYWLKDFVSN